MLLGLRALGSSDGADRRHEPRGALERPISTTRVRPCSDDIASVRGVVVSRLSRRPRLLDARRATGCRPRRWRPISRDCAAVPDQHGVQRRPLPRPCRGALPGARRRPGADAVDFMLEARARDGGANEQVSCTGAAAGEDLVPKIMLHNAEARHALARGVPAPGRRGRADARAQGPERDDRPAGRHADDHPRRRQHRRRDRAAGPFENMGAQVVREVSMQTNEVAGDGTTTAIVLANAMVQRGVEATEAGAKAVDLCRGIDLAVEAVVAALEGSGATRSRASRACGAVANIAATDAKLGALVAEAFARVGADGVITTEYGVTTETVLEVVEGMSFDRGYLSHHMVTDAEKMEVVLDNPLILMTDLKIKIGRRIGGGAAIAEEHQRPLLIIAEEMRRPKWWACFGKRGPQVRSPLHPPEYGHWRKAMLEDLAILTGGRVIARDLGGRIEDDPPRISAGRGRCASAIAPSIIRGDGRARADRRPTRTGAAPVRRRARNIEQDKLRERLAKLSGGTAVIQAGGVTPVEQKRIQLIEDAMNATRAAAEEGVVAGGGISLMQTAPMLDRTIDKLEGDSKKGAQLVRQALSTPLALIIANSGRDSAKEIAGLANTRNGYGFDARSGHHVEMIKAGIVDPVKVCYSAVCNAGSVAALILTTQTLIAKKPDDYDVTAGPARGGGAERL